MNWWENTSGGSSQLMGTELPTPLEIYVKRRLVLFLEEPLHFRM